MTDKNQEIEKPTAAIQVQLAQYNPTPSTESSNKRGWIEYGADNSYPNYLIDLYSSCPVHGSLTKSIVKMISGKGFQSTASVELERIGADKALPKIAHDLKVQGGYFIEVIWANDKKTIAKINSLPFKSCRLGFVRTDNEDEIINGVWYSHDWSSIRKKCNAPVFIPRFNPSSVTEEVRQVYWFFMDKGNNLHYPQPDYEPSITWIDCERQIGLYHINNLYNGLFPAFIINFMNGQVTPEEAQDIKRDWERKLSGAGNAGKFIMTFNESDKAAPKVDLFPLSDADKQYEFLSRESTLKVLMGHRVTTPLLFGVRTENGGLGSNTDEMKTGLQIFTSDVIEPFQRDICDGLEEILQGQGTETEITIISNSQVEVSPSDTPAGTAPVVSGEPVEDVASQALNGAQIESLINIVIQASTGAVPVDTCRAIVQAGFPMLTEEQINNIFESVNPGSLDTTEVIQSKIRAAVFSSLKKKAAPELLIELGEDGDEDWIQIDGYRDDEIEYANTGTARPNASSEQDALIDDKLFISRYIYGGEMQRNTREFCSKMLGAGKYYRKEDILQMADKPVNAGWGPNGAATYDIWKYKGGGDCHHWWERVVFVSAKGLKIDVNSPKAKELATEKAAALGYKVKNPAYVARMPKDMRNRGFLKPRE